MIAHLLGLILAFWAQTNIFPMEKGSKYDEGKVYRHTLENGLTILTMEKHDVPFIFHQLSYKVGSVNEPAGLTGISHVVEHMMFKGTRKYSRGQIAQIISQNSGIFNAFTSWDMTSYYMYLPKNKIEIALDIESDRMRNSIFDSLEFKSEINVILQERKTRMDNNPGGIFQENLYSVAFTLSPYRNPIIGWEEDLKNIKWEDAYRYYKTYYTPNNAVLVLVGDFDTEEMLRLVKKYYADIPPGPAVPSLEIKEPRQKVKKEFRLIHSDVKLPSVTMVFPAPNYIDPDAPALYLAGKILCDRSRGSRLYKRLVEVEKIALNVGGGLQMSKYPRLFSISVGLNPDSSVDRVEEIVWEEINRMKKEPVTEYELRKAKNRYKFTQATEYVKNSDIAMRISTWECYYGWDYYDRFYEAVLNVTAEDIMRVMNKYFSENAVTIGYLLPAEKKSGEQIEEDIDEPSEYGQFFYNNLLENKAIEIAGNTLDDIVRPRRIAPLVKTARLKNGIKVYTIENKFVPTIVVAGVVEAGVIPEEIEGKAGISAVLADVMNRGPLGLSYEEYIDTLSFYPISIIVRGNYRGFSFEGYSHIDNKEKMIDMLFNVIAKPRFDSVEINLVKDKHIAVAKRRFVGTKVRAFYYMFDKIFKDHEYSKNKVTPETISRIKVGDIVKHYRKYIRPERTTLVVVGNMKHDEMLNLVRKYFESWRNPEQAEPIKSVSSIKVFKEREIKVFTDSGYTECTINIGFAPHNDVDPKDEEVVDILNYILAGGALTSRVGVELREKQGLIYGIRSQLWSTRDRIGYWKFNTKTAPENVERVVRGIFSEIKKLLEDGITEEELVNAKKRKLGLLPLYIETPEDIASIVVNSVINKIPLDDFDKKYDRIKAVTVKDVLRVARKYLTLDKFIVVIDGPIIEGKIKEILEDI